MTTANLQQSMRLKELGLKQRGSYRYDDVTRIEETEEGGHMGLIRVYHIFKKDEQGNEW